MRSLNVFFDVDNTLIMWNGRLRNHTREVFERLRETGHTIYIWSGVGIRRWDMRRHDLDEFVEDYFIKPLDNHHERLPALGVPFAPDFVIDDHKTVVEFVEDYFIKPLDNHHERLPALGVPFAPDFVIDDHKTVVDAFGGYHISDMVTEDDRELLDVLAAIEEMAGMGDVEEPLTDESVEVEPPPD